MTKTTDAPILVVDDEELIRQWLTESLSAEGFNVISAATGAEALQAVEQFYPALALLDLRLPDANGIELLPRIREIDPDMVVVIITAYGEVSTAVEAVKAGAFDFLEKPINLEKLTLVVRKGLETRHLRQQIAGLRQQHRWRFADVELVGRSTATQELVGMVHRLADTNATVLLEGESGTGKDLVARAIHAHSERRDNPFIDINCTTLPDHLAESELFGHERGSFTDARERKKGLVELADSGTLFLDEIGDMRPETQGKLLRFLENAKIRRVGGTADIPVDVRVIAATNRNLETLVSEGSFRNDLYFRLNVMPIVIPPLRERREDIAPLASYFVEHLARNMRREPVELTADTVQALEEYSWPGNVRQLKNVLERVLILERGREIRREHLPAELDGQQRQVATTGATLALPQDGLSLEEVEQNLIRQALSRTGGNVTKAATLLGLSRDTLRYRLDKYHIAGVADGG